MLANLGPEPFGQDFTPQHLQKMATGKNRPLKNFLMDNRVVVGIGNIYACEILFHAGLNPNKKARSLTKKQWTEIVESSRYVLEKAIKSGGTYGRQGKPCGCCATPISKITMGGRSTFFCPKCQK
jgi:formamidopyrimidine-DNA glycosylase